MIVEAVVCITAVVFTAAVVFLAPAVFKLRFNFPRRDTLTLGTHEAMRYDR